MKEYPKDRKAKVQAPLKRKKKVVHFEEITKYFMKKYYSQ